MMRCKDFQLCPAMRKRILELDDHKCVVCEFPENLAVHHVQYRVPCREEDLVTLCSLHHSEARKFDAYTLREYAKKRRKVNPLGRSGKKGK